MIRFAETEAERQGVGDPRPSLEKRYASRDAWAAQLAEAVDRFVAERLLLAEDGDRLKVAARESWDVYQAL
jgi:Alpha/beta hydrolase domain